jgi:DNA-binding NtrC family response regulator
MVCGSALTPAQARDGFPDVNGAPEILTRPAPSRIAHAHNQQGGAAACRIDLPAETLGTTKPIAEIITRSLVGRTVAQVERDLILDTLDHCLGNRTHAARMLGISIRALRNKLGEYTAAGVAVPEPGQARAMRA